MKSTSYPPPTSFKNRLYRGDCLEVLQRLYSEGIEVDLIYLDPPFNSNKVYNLVFSKGGKDAQQVAFSDAWGGTHAEQLRLAFTDMLEEMNIPVGLKNIVKLWVDVLLQGNNSDKRLLNYLIYITERLIWMQKVLSSKGSIYLHCDPTASHYLKVMMDAVFGRENFRNEIIWGYRTGGLSTKKGSFARKHDVILFYAKNNINYFNRLKTKSYAPTLPEPHTKSGQKLGVKKDHINKYRMVYMRDWWINTGIMPDDDIREMYRNDSERMGYPTQKPVALLRRIIKASCRPNGIVLDTFCGCGTTIEAAAELNMNWIGVDISRYAIENIEKRIEERLGFEHQSYELINCTPQTFSEYEKLGHYEKQKFLVEKVGGVSGGKGGDKGVDGTIKIHIGDDKKGNPQWGVMILSVKTGKQVNPAHLRELKGTMQNFRAVMGGLILDQEPTQNMEKEADASKKLKYRTGRYSAEFRTIQILTADDILNNLYFDTPSNING